MTLLRAKAPLRVSFAGGGTDVSPYPEERGGAVLNCTIDKYAYASLIIEPDGRSRTKVHSLDYSLSVDYPGDRQAWAYDGKLDLVTAALKVLRPGQPRKEHSDSLELYLHTDAPPGTGLGSSSTMCVALVGVFQHYLREWWSNYDIAELAYRIEREELGVRGGRQDQYAATFGGFNFMEFGRERTIVHPLRVPAPVLNELAYRMLLCYTGTSHFSNDIIQRQQAGYTAGRKETVDALDATKQLAIDMKNALLRGDLDTMGALLDEGWQLKKRFTEGISNELIDAFYDRARAAGAQGGKLVGAGGGGYLLLFCDPRRRADVQRAVQASGGRVVDFGLEPNGLQTWAAGKAE